MSSEDKTLLLEIRNKLDDLMLLIPSKISLSDLSMQVGKSSNTILKYIKDNYEPEADYKKIGGKIYIEKDVALALRRKYAR